MDAAPDCGVAGSPGMQGPDLVSADQLPAWQDAEAAIDQLIAEAERAASVAGCWDEGPGCGGHEGGKVTSSCKQAAQCFSPPLPPCWQEAQEEQEQQLQRAQHAGQQPLQGCLTGCDAAETWAVQVGTSGCRQALSHCSISVDAEGLGDEDGSDSEDEQLERKYGLRPLLTWRSAADWCRGGNSRGLHDRTSPCL